MSGDKTTLPSLYAKYISSISSLDSDEEMAFLVELSKVGNGFNINSTNMNNLQRYVKNMADKIVGSYNNLFVATKTTTLFKDNSEEWKALITTINGLNLYALSYYGLLMIGHTLLFMLRVTRRVIYKFKLDDIEDRNDKSNISSALLALFSHTNTTIQQIVKHDKEVSAYLQNVLEKAKGHDTNDTNIARQYLDKLLQNPSDKEHLSIPMVSPSLILPTTLNTNVGVDEEMLLLYTSYSIEQIIKDDTEGYKKAKRLVERLRSNIVMKYSKLYEDTDTNDVLNKSKWEGLQKQIRDVDLDNLSFAGLTTVGNALLFLLRSTRKMIYKYKLADLKEVSTDKIKQEVNHLFDYIGKILSNLQNLVAASNAQAISILDKARAYDNNIYDIALQDIPKNISNFQSLANNLRELLTKFNAIKTRSGSDEATKALKAKIGKAETNGLRYVKKVFFESGLKDAIDFLNSYLDVKINVAQFESADYNSLKEFLIMIQNLGSLQQNIRKKIKGEEELKRVLQQLKSYVYPSSKLYFNCLELYEFLSGTIRIVVRKKDEQAKKTEYDIVLNHMNNTVSFEGVEHIYKLYFGDTSLVKEGKVNNTFGPFYGLFPRDAPTNVAGKIMANTKSNTVTNAIGNTATNAEKQLAIQIAREKAIKVANDVIENALNFETLLTTIKEHSTNMVLYSYGYSGSGKTFNFFGDLKTKDYEFGIVFRLFNKLKEHGATVKLLKRIKVYGVLEPKEQASQDTMPRFVFNDYVLPLEYKGKNTEKLWAQTILEDLERKQTDLLGFVKSTSNNQDSSRGFYMLKFEVSYLDKTTNQEKKSYIGIVDMAGNEDPFDITNAMIPTLDMSNFKMFLEGELDASAFDVVYKEIKNVIVDIIVIILLFLITMKRNQNKLYDQQKTWVTNPNHVVYEELSMLKNVHKTFKDIAKQDGAVTIQNKNNNYVLELDPKICIVEWNNTNQYTMTFTAEESLIVNILSNKKNKIIKDMKQQINDSLKDWLDIEIERKASLAVIQEISAKSRIDPENKTVWTNLLLLKKLEYMLMSLKKEVYPHAEWKDITLKLSINAEPKSIHFPPDINDKMLNVFKTNKKNKQMIGDITKQISTYFCDQRYMLPILIKSKDPATGINIETNHWYRYSDLLQIVKEGYYINKAIAELIHFFQRKRNYEDSVIDTEDPRIYVETQPPSLTNANRVEKKVCNKLPSTIPVNPKKKSSIMTYPFKGNFDFQSYNKFTAKFHVDDSDKDNTISQYDTSLVQTIYNEFPYDNVKHIMFACVRNLDQDDKIIGAISTLYLVQDLKST